MKVKFIIIIFSQMLFSKELYYYQNNKKVYLYPIENNIEKRVVSNGLNKIKYYKTSKNIKVGISTKIIIKFVKNADINKIIDKYKIKIEKKLTDSIYVVSVNDFSETIKVANRLYEDKNIVYAHPDFIKKINKR